MGKDDGSKEQGRARRVKAGARAGSHAPGDREYGATIDPAFVEDPLTGGTRIVPRRGCFLLRKDKWYEPRLKDR